MTGDTDRRYEMSDRRRRFAVMGPTKSGKSTLAQLLCREGEWPYHLIQDFRELCGLGGILATRENLVAVTESFRALGGTGVLAIIAISRGARVVEGVRFAAEAEALRAAGYVLLYVETPAYLRAARRQAGGDLGAVPLEGEAMALEGMADGVVPGHEVGGFLEVADNLLKRADGTSPPAAIATGRWDADDL